MQLSFLGATGTVTGSKYLLAVVGSKKILIDCGLFQGYKALRLRNWEKFPVETKSIDAVALTHAHIDHTGYLPLLVKNGFTGPIYATAATRDLCNILLPDSGHLQEEDARFANKYGFSKHKPALPLYTQEEAVEALKQFQVVEYENSYDLFGEIDIRWHRAGHILGSAFIDIQEKKTNTSILFTGDIGRLQDPIMKPPVFIKGTDYLVIESTYGNRLHESNDPSLQIAKIINETVKRGGSIIIPAFAVGRAQSILYYISKLKEAKKIPDLPVFLDTPMGINATQIMCKHKQEHHLSIAECKLLCNVAHYTNTPDDSKKLDNYPVPIIIISASGMATGGRILHHLKVFAPEPRNTILFTGYQAGGTRGARMINGETEIKIHGQNIPVRARIEMISNTSAHADYQEIIQWLEHFERPPKKVFITHGEAAAAASLKEKIEKRFGWSCFVPDYLYTENLK